MIKIKYVLCVIILVAKSFTGFSQEKQTPTGDTTKAIKKPVGITEKIKSSKQIPGLFTLYQDTITGSLQIYIRKDQLNKEFIYQSFSLGGQQN